MPTSSLVSGLAKPFTSYKRLFGLLTIGIVLIGAMVAGYYYHIKSNEHNFREAKLQSLDSHFNIISRQLTNDVQSYNSREKVNLKVGGDSLQYHAYAIERTIDSIWKEPGKSLRFNKEFDEYILIIQEKDSLRTDIYKSSLEGLVAPPDSLFQSSILNIGVSMAIPEKDTDYQLFGREYVFQTPFNRFVTLDVTIIGLVKAERYNETIRKLDPWIIALLTTFLLLCLFGLPFFKMLFIAEDERLSSKDVILSGISVVVGAPIMMVIFLSLMNHYYDYYHVVPDRLHTLSTTIGARFEEENKAIVDQLGTALLMEDSRYLSEKEQFYSGLETDSLWMNNFKFISKIDPEGKVLFHIALINKDNIKQTKTLDSRPYFKDFDAKNNLWLSANGTEYVMRPVVSIEDQTEEAVYILRNEEDLLSGYRVGSVQLKSMHDPILPFGYEFAVVDASGEVWFHSEEGRATLENFFTVSREFDDLKAAVVGRVNVGGLVNYREDGKLFNVTPVKGTNLSVITFYDIGLLRTRVSEVLSLASTAIICAFLLMFLITILSLVIRNPKLGLYKYNTFLFEFLTPKKEKRETYMLLSGLFLSILGIAIAVGSCFPVAPSKVYSICLLLAIWAYLTVYYTLHPYRNRRAIKFRVRDVMLLTVIIALNVLILKLDAAAIGFLVVIIVLQCCFLFFIIRGQLFELPKGIKKLCESKLVNIHIAYRYWYAIFLFSWLALAAVYPSYLFFQKAKDVNDQVWFKADQMHIAEGYMAKERKLIEKLPAYPAMQIRFSQLYAKHLRGGLYPDGISVAAHKESVAFEPLHNDLVFREFLWNIRPVYDERVRKFQALVYEQAQDSLWDSTEKLDSLGVSLNYLDQKGSIAISGRSAENFIRLGLGFPYLKLAGILLILAILLSLILFFVDRFFALRFRHLKPNDFDTDTEKGYVDKFARMLLAEKSNSGLFLMGLPFSGKRHFAKKIIAAAGYTKVATLSMLRLDIVDSKADISETLGILATGVRKKKYASFNWEAQEVFIIEHLEHNLKSFDANHTKLQLISFLISERKRVILVSEVYPSQILALYDNPAKDSGLPWGSLEDDFNSWRNILSAFPQVVIGITKNEERVYEVLKEEDRVIDPAFDKTIYPLIKELGHSKFLPTLAPIILSKTLYESEDPKDANERLDLQRMIMHTQNVAHGYYNDIWNSLPTRERYMLYDLAKDGFLNIKNRHSLFSLMKKGLVVWDDRPAIFNYSFKNFIVTSVSLNEALRLENKNRGKSSWGSLRILFYLIILTIIIFIALGKPDLITDFQSVIGALGGLGVIIPLVSKFLATGGRK